MKTLLAAVALSVACATASAAVLPPKPTAKQEAATPCPWVIEGVWNRLREWIINPWMIS